VTQLQWLSS